MATRKKTKTKAKQTGKTKKKTPARKAARKQVARKPVRKKVAARKTAQAKPKSAPRKAAAATRAPSAPAPGERIGVVTHYFNHLSVAIIQVETGNLRVGEMVRIKGHTSDFSQPVESMEVDHMPVDEVHSGQSVGLRVKEHAREHDVVYKLVQ